MAIRDQLEVKDKRACSRHHIKNASVTSKRAGLNYIFSPLSSQLPLLNISLSGCRFVTAKRFEKGHRIKMVHHIPNQMEPLVVAGEIRWAHRYSGKNGTYKVGVEFQNISDEVQARLKMILESVHRQN